MVDAAASHRDISCQSSIATDANGRACLRLSEAGNAALAASLMLPLTSVPTSEFLELTDAFKSPTRKLVTDKPPTDPSPKGNLLIDKAQPDRAPVAEAGWFTKTKDWFEGAADITGQVIKGAASTAYQDVTEHPGLSALHLAEGAVVGVAIVAAAPIAGVLGAGAAVVSATAMVADVTLVGLSTFASVHAASEVSHVADQVSHSSDVLMHSDAYSSAEVKAARQDIQAKTGSVALSATGVAIGVGANAASGMKVASALTRLVRRQKTVESDADGAIVVAADGV
jgi:hypothetical protein